MFNNYFQNGWLRKVVSSGLTATFAVSTFGSCTGKAMEDSEQWRFYDIEKVTTPIERTILAIPKREQEELAEQAKTIAAAFAFCVVLILAIETASVISDEKKDKEFVNKLTNAEKELFDKFKYQLVSVLNEGIYIRKSRKKLEGLKVILRDKNSKEIVSITARPGQSVDDFAHKVTIAEFRNRQFYRFMEINYLA